MRDSIETPLQVKVGQTVHDFQLTSTKQKTVVFLETPDTKNDVTWMQDLKDHLAGGWQVDQISCFTDGNMFLPYGMNQDLDSLAIDWASSMEAMRETCPFKQRKVVIHFSHVLNQTLDKAVEEVDLYFRSGNDIPIKRANVQAEEWYPVRDAVAKLREQLADAQGNDQENKDLS